MTLIDTNVLLDLVTNDILFVDWSVRQLDLASMRGRLAINDVIYAELSVRFAAIEALDAWLDQAGIAIVPIPRAALFLAGRAHLLYRKAGGTRSGVLPDFFIGAHAAISGATLLTRDGRRTRRYFPTVAVTAP